MAIYALGDKQPQFDPDKVFIAPSADILGDVVLHPGANIWFNATLRGDDNRITIGENTNIQDGAVVHVDARYPCTLGRNITVGHLAMVHGCTIGDNTLVGINSTILDNAKIGKNTLIGAHSLIGGGKEFPDGVMVLGSPAKVVRELKPEEIQFLEASGRMYAEKGARFREQLRVV